METERNRLPAFSVGALILVFMFAFWAGCGSDKTAEDTAEVKEKKAREAFAMGMIRTLRESGFQKKIRYDAEDFSLIIGEDGKGRMYLGNVYDEYNLAAESERAGIVANFAKVALLGGKPLPEDYAEARTHILPRLRNPAYHSLAHLLNRLKDNTFTRPPRKMVTRYFAANLIYDWPEYTQDIQQEDLDEWNVTFESAWTQALENLLEISRTPFQQPAAGVYVSPWQDNHDGARLFLTEIFDMLKIKGDPVVMVPNRDTLIITGSDDGEGLKKMVELAKAALEKPRTESGTALRRTSKGWVPFLPETDDALRNEFLLLHASALAVDYQYQKELLDRLNVKDGTDLFVAKYSVMSHQDTGKVMSYSVWTRGIVSLLPKTTHIAFYDSSLPEDKRVVEPVEWDKVARVVGNLLKKEDLYPPRYKVEHYPTPEQINLIKKEISK
jgi:hypothetical protein